MPLNPELDVGEFVIVELLVVLLLLLLVVVGVPTRLKGPNGVGTNARLAASTRKRRSTTATAVRSAWTIIVFHLVPLWNIVDCLESVGSLELELGVGISGGSGVRM